MSDLLLGAAVMWLLGFIAACFIDRETVSMLVGFVLAVLVAPVLVTAEGLRKLGLFGAIRIDAAALQRFAGQKRKGGGGAFVFFYSPRRGVIFIRGLRNNEPVPPIRINSSERAS